MEVLKGILANYELYLDALAQFVGWVVVGLSIFLRVKPSSKAENAYGKLNKALDKAAQYFPTVGINPRTKALQEWAEENKENFPELKKIIE